MEIIASIIWAIIGGFACNRMSKSQGRNVAIWTILGILFSFIAIIVLYWRGDTDQVALRKAQEKIRN